MMPYLKKKYVTCILNLNINFIFVHTVDYFYTIQSLKLGKIEIFQN